MTPPGVSVVLPTHNRAATLPRAMRSVLDQGYRPLELIVVDDGSTDGTAAVVRQCSDPRVRLLTRPQGGPGAARNSGLAAAHGELIAFQDSDDEWLPGKLERQVGVLQAEPGIGLVVCGYREVTPAGPIDWPAPLGTGGPLPELLRGRNYITPTWLVRRAALERAGTFDESLPSCEDYDLALRLSDVCRFGAVPELLVLKHNSAASIYNHPRSRAVGRRRAFEKHRRRWDAHTAWLAEQERAVGLLLLHDGQPAGLTYLARALARDPAGQLRALSRRLAARLGWD